MMVHMSNVDMTGGITWDTTGNAGSDTFFLSFLRRGANTDSGFFTETAGAGTVSINNREFHARKDPMINALVGSSPYTHGKEEQFIESNLGSAGTINLVDVNLYEYDFLYIKDITGDASTNPITIDASGAQEIDGALTFTINKDFGWVVLTKATTGSPDAWHVAGSNVFLAASSTGEIQESTSSTDTVSNETKYFLSNPSGAGAVALALPAGANHFLGSVYIKDKKGNAGADNITITPNGAETIDGAGTLVLSTNYDSVRLLFNGTEWSVI